MHTLCPSNARPYSFLSRICRAAGPPKPRQPLVAAQRSVAATARTALPLQLQRGPAAMRAATAEAQGAPAGPALPFARPPGQSVVWRASRPRLTAYTCCGSERLLADACGRAELAIFSQPNYRRPLHWARPAPPSPRGASR